jgi:hypothetical protein
MNTRTLWIGAAVLVFAVGCNRNDRQTSSGSVLDRTNDRQARITVTGCLKPGEQGLEPNAASRSAEGVDRFVLANASTSATVATGPLYILEGRAELRHTLGSSPSYSHLIDRGVQGGPV